MEAPHGTFTRYRQGCFCDRCKAAMKVHRRMLKDGDIAIVRRKPLDENVAHGTTTRYRRGCRCKVCKAGMAEYERRRRLISDKVPMGVRLDKTLVDKVYAHIRDRPVRMSEMLEWGLALVLKELAREEGTGLNYRQDRWLSSFIRSLPE